MYSPRKPRNSKDDDGSLYFSYITLILLFPQLTPAEPIRLFFFAFHRVRNGRGFNRASTSASSLTSLSSVRGKRFFPQFPRDCLLRKFSTPIDCPLLGQIIFIIFLGACPLAVRATLWPPRNEDAQPLAQPCTCSPLIFIRRANDAGAPPARLTKLSVRSPCLV